MDRTLKKTHRRTRIKTGIRKKILGTGERPRLTVYRSNKEIYAQIIDDVKHVTLVSAASNTLTDAAGKTPVEKAMEVGKLIAAAAVSANIEKVVFDRNGFLYHGRIKAVAEGARQGGLQF